MTTPSLLPGGFFFFHLFIVTARFVLSFVFFSLFSDLLALKPSKTHPEHPTHHILIPHLQKTQTSHSRSPSNPRPKMGHTDDQKPEYQTVRLKKGEFHPGLRKVSWTEFRVPIFSDNAIGRKVVLLSDILLFVPKAKQLQIEENELAVCIGMDRKELQPIRFEARPDHIIDVVG